MGVRRLGQGARSSVYHGRPQGGARGTFKRIYILLTNYDMVSKLVDSRGVRRNVSRERQERRGMSKRMRFNNPRDKEVKRRSN